jgi:hypothetical protein
MQMILLLRLRRSQDANLGQWVELPLPFSIPFLVGWGKTRTRRRLRGKVTRLLRRLLILVTSPRLLEALRRLEVLEEEEEVVVVVELVLRVAVEEGVVVVVVLMSRVAVVVGVLRIAAVEGVVPQVTMEAEALLREVTAEAEAVVRLRVQAQRPRLETRQAEHRVEPQAHHRPQVALPQTTYPPAPNSIPKPASSPQTEDRPI